MTSRFLRYIALLCSLCVASLSLQAQTRPPVPISQPQPEYSASLKNRGITGTVVFTFVVTKDGDVRQIDVVESPHPELARSVVRAVKKWKFEPPMKNGRRVNNLMRQRITFSIENAEKSASGGEEEEEKKAGEPGATDNPDDAQRFREDH